MLVQDLPQANSQLGVVGGCVGGLGRAASVPTVISAGRRCRGRGWRMHLLHVLGGGTGLWAMMVWTQQQQAETYDEVNSGAVGMPWCWPCCARA